MYSGARSQHVAEESRELDKDVIRLRDLQPKEAMDVFGEYPRRKRRLPPFVGLASKLPGCRIVRRAVPRNEEGQQETSHCSEV
jgi:hypothetical protein